MGAEAPLLPMEWLVDQQIISTLVGFLGVSADAPGDCSVAAENAAEALVQIIEHYSNLAPWRWDATPPIAPLIEQLQSADVSAMLVERSVDAQGVACRHTLAVLTALLELLREERDGAGGPSDGAREEGTPELVQSLAGRGGALLAGLSKKPRSVTGGEVQLTFGVVPESLGPARMSLLQMLLALLRTGAAEVAAMFATVRLFEPLLELCFALRFNNSKHCSGGVEMPASPVDKYFAA